MNLNFLPEYLLVKFLMFMLPSFLYRTFDSEMSHILTKSNGTHFLFEKGFHNNQLLREKHISHSQAYRAPKA